MYRNYSLSFNQYGSFALTAVGPLAHKKIKLGPHSFASSKPLQTLQTFTINRNTFNEWQFQKAIMASLIFM